MNGVPCSICKLTKLSPERAALGYSTCLSCGEEFAQKLANTRREQVAPAYNKGAYQYITTGDLKTIGR